ERFLDLLLGHDATAEEELDDAAAFGLERAQLLTSGDGGCARAERTEKLLRRRVLRDERRRAGGKRKVAHPGVTSEEHDRGASGPTQSLRGSVREGVHRTGEVAYQPNRRDDAESRLRRSRYHKSALTAG